MTPEQEAELLEVVVRIDTKLDGVIEAKQDHETRLRGLERFRFMAAGGASALGALLGWMAGNK